MTRNDRPFDVVEEVVRIRAEQDSQPSAPRKPTRAEQTQDGEAEAPRKRTRAEQKNDTAASLMYALHDLAELRRAAHRAGNTDQELLERFMEHFRYGGGQELRWLQRFVDAVIRP